MLEVSGSLPRAAPAAFAAAPETSGAQHQHVAERIEADETSRGRKVQSAALLALLVSVLGVAAAAIVGILLVALTSFVDQALG